MKGNLSLLAAVCLFFALAAAARPEKIENALQKAPGFLRARRNEIEEPYQFALFGPASLDAGNIEDAVATAEKLATMAVEEGDRVYRTLETDTPFYGRGTPGRIETTALVLLLLIKAQKTENNLKPQNQILQDLLTRSSLFLLKNKDRYGVWYSTQTTINVDDGRKVFRPNGEFLRLKFRKGNFVVSVNSESEKTAGKLAKYVP